MLMTAPVPETSTALPFYGLRPRLPGNLDRSRPLRNRSGTLATGGYALCSSKGSKERIGRMMEMHSNDRQARSVISCAKFKAGSCCVGAH